MTQNFHKLLLSELRMAVYQPGNPKDITDERLCEAVTLNENLRSLGLALRPADMVHLAVSGSLYTLHGHLAELLPEVKDKPMYPGFPQEVLEMSEAMFRMHQALHYASTYGLEMLTGLPVHRGWLPEFDASLPSEEDQTLLESRVIELIPEAEAATIALRKLLERRERLTEPELELARECVPACEPEKIGGMRVRFKENLDLLFPAIMDCEAREKALPVLRGICSHPGDVMRCCKEYLSQKKFHLSTSEKKLLVRLLESYPVRSFRENLMQSLRLRERNLRVLERLDYNRFSRSLEHREAVRALRNGELLSWQGIGEKMLREKNPEALSWLAQRPGYMVRMLNRLLSLDYSPEEIKAVLLPRADAISGHLALRTVSALTRRRQEMEKKHQQEIAECERKYRLESMTPCRPYSEAQTEANRKRAEAKQRWVDCPEMVLHREIFQEVEVLRERLKQMQQNATRLRTFVLQMESRSMKNSRLLLVQNANAFIDLKAMKEALENPEDFEKNPKKALRKQLYRAESDIERMKSSIAETRTRCQLRYNAELAAQRPQWAVNYETELAEIRLRETEGIRREEAQYAEALRQYEKNLKTLPERKAAELKSLAEKHQREIRISQFEAASVQILQEVLREHFRKADTPLKGKKVFLEMDQFDLAHSELETENRSKDGGYIRSGICYRIPEEARYVRFFVYWDDSRRVDIDLHAGGVTTKGESLHVGWNADFRRDGVVHSGDITHSDAAEYIDIDLQAPIQEIYANIHLFSGRRSLREVETCYVGMMAVSEANQEVKHYDPRNCFFTHEMRQNVRQLFYGYINVADRYVQFIGQPNTECWEARPNIADDGARFSLKDYLDCVLAGQECQMVSRKGQADIILTMGKSEEENGISLVDHNFFLES